MSNLIYGFENPGRHHYLKGFLYGMPFALYELYDGTKQGIKDLDLVRSDYHVRRT